MKNKTFIVFVAISVVLLYTAATISMLIISKREEKEQIVDIETKANKDPSITTKTGTDKSTGPHITTKTDTTQKPNKTKKVAFTFDDGPHHELTYKFVDELKKYNGVATFFVVGNRIDVKTGKAIKYAYDSGCQIEIHAYTHTVMFDNCTDKEYCDELEKTEKAIQKYIKKDIKYMRPPGGRISNEHLAACKYSVIMWSVDSDDWKYKSRGNEKQQNIDTIVNNVLSSVHDGDIVLMHEIYENSYEAFCIIARELDRQGYEFVTVEELLGESIQVGKIYSKARAN